MRRKPRAALEIALLEAMLAARGALFMGRRHECPVCGARIRAFTQGGGSLKTRALGYCPRCNAKARHRRVWIHCRRETDLFNSQLRLLHVSPKYCLSRQLVHMPNVEYTAIDVVPRHLTTLGDLTALDFPDGSFDAILCVHVLEHIADDRAAMQEMSRVLRPGGWAVVNVPVELDGPHTYEDPTIVTPTDRRRAFGEADHVRVYGADVGERLEQAGFKVTLFRGDRMSNDLVERHGLTTNEHVFHCTKPGGATS